MNPKTNKKIGIIDGMGAFAGARFFQTLLEKITSHQLPFPEIIIDALNVDDFIADETKIEPAFKLISQRLTEFNRLKVSMVVMACNTAHLMHPRLQPLSAAPFPSIIEEVTLKAKSLRLRRLGILASPLTLKTKLYETSAFNSGLTPVIPDQQFQDLLERIIRHVLSNQLTPEDRRELFKKSHTFIKENHLDGLILGCTELPLAFNHDNFKDCFILDSIDILADTLIKHLEDDGSAFSWRN